jgi:prepilin-type N-terminal cleavage/methylation domain-containing protein/prepilin-type processing-associated H-X9-DG protein
MGRKGFSLVELLVVVTMIGLLMALLGPALVRARMQSKAVVCRSNLRQLYLANSGYAGENGGYCVVGAPDVYMAMGGLRRWHGVRADVNEPFDANEGPLAAFLAEGKVKECPARVKFRHDGWWDYNFEDGCGGYGYNTTYLGSRVWQAGLEWAQRYERSSQVSEVRRAGETVMFADCAMSKRHERSGVPYLHEYSFAEAPWLVVGGRLLEGVYASPSVHFRHLKRANAVWVDGHVSCEVRTEYEGYNAYGVRSADMQLGWFGPLDNQLFDLW